MKTVVVIFGILGLVDSLGLVLFQVFGVLSPVYGIHASLGFVAACVCFSAIAVIDTIAPDAVMQKKRRFPSADDVLGPE